MTIISILLIIIIIIILSPLKKKQGQPPGFQVRFNPSEKIIGSPTFQPQLVSISEVLVQPINSCHSAHSTPRSPNSMFSPLSVAHFFTILAAWRKRWMMSRKREYPKSLQFLIDRVLNLSPNMLASKWMFLYTKVCVFFWKKKEPHCENSIFLLANGCEEEALIANK